MIVASTKQVSIHISVMEPTILHAVYLHVHLPNSNVNYKIEQLCFILKLLFKCHFED